MHSIRTPSSSIINGTSKNKDQTRKGSFQDSNGKREIPRVEIFLDCHLSKAIQQIRMGNNKAAIVKPINLIGSQKKTELGNNSWIMEEKEQAKVNAQYQQVDRKQRQQIELMPNDIVLDYIQEVYQKYGIINPFDGYLNDKISHLNIQYNQNSNNNNKSQSNRKQQINTAQTKGKRVRKNWHSFSQQKQSRFGEQHNIGPNQLIHQGPYEHYDDNFATLKKFHLVQNNDKEFINYNRKDNVKTEKKKLSQNQQRILQLKNKFKLIDSGGDNNRNEKQSAIHTIIINQQQKQYQIPPPPTTHQKKQSYGSITYIDNLKNLMQSQLVDFDSSSRANGNSSERNKLITMRFINSMGDVMGTMRDGKMVGPGEREDNSRVDHTQSAIRPKKKLFVKTVRGNSTKNSIQGTPVGAESAKKSNNNIFQESSLMLIDTNSKQQIAFGNNNLFMSNHIAQNYSSHPQAFPYRTSLTSSVTTSSMYIPQNHRYCLGCQYAILDSNILYHEQNCSAWRRIASLSVEQLLQIVDNKVRKIRQKLSQSELFNLKMDDIEEIKALGKRILDGNVQEQEQSQKINSSKQVSYQISKNNVNRIDKLLQKKVLRGCQMIKKLQWFIKLRATIQSQIDSQPNKDQQRENNIRRPQQKKISAFSLIQ